MAACAKNERRFHRSDRALYGFRDLKVYGQLNKWERRAYLRRIGAEQARRHLRGQSMHVL